MEHFGSIYCVGKNYPDHALEMAAMEPIPAVDPRSRTSPGEPIIFMKPPAALSLARTTTIPIFDGSPVSSDMHHEVELVLLIGRNADSVSLDEASSCISGYAVGLDMTLRDVQLAAKREGNPWLKSKGFRNSALISEFVPPAAAGPWESLSISLRRNGRVVQHSPVSKMTFPPAYLVHYLSYIYGLRRGDLIFTGTPAGVGRTERGDRLDAALESEAGDGEQCSVLAALEAIVT